MVSRVTAPKIRQMKAEGTKIVFLTAYDYTSALIADASGVDAILVGDSLGNVIQGHPTTVPVSLEEMEYHTRIVARGASRALVVADLPFGSYGANVPQAVNSAFALMKAGAGAVKLEGLYPEEIKAMTQAGIPVMGHLGFTPQSIHNFGGHKVQGRGDSAELIIEQSVALAEAGAFAIVLELVPSELASRISESINIPTIGIGAGKHCDGQVQVWHDILGLSKRKFKHAKRYAEAAEIFETAISEYTNETRLGQFPTNEQSFE